MKKVGRPEGASFTSKTSVLTVLMDSQKGLIFKDIIERSGLDKRTVSKTLKELCDDAIKVVKKEKRGKYRIYRVIDRSYYSKLRLQRRLKETKPLIDTKIEDMFKGTGIKPQEVLKRLLKDRYVERISAGDYFDLILRRVKAEIITERKESRRI